MDYSDNKTYEEKLKYLKGATYSSLVFSISFFIIAASYIFLGVIDDGQGVLIFICMLGAAIGILCAHINFKADLKELEKMTPEQYEQAQKDSKIAAYKKANEEAQRQREFLQTRKELMEKGIVSCPRCGSTAITSVKQGPHADTFAEGYSWARKLSGGCTVLNVCQNCNHRFYPGV